MGLIYTVHLSDDGFTGRYGALRPIIWGPYLYSRGTRTLRRAVTLGLPTRQHVRWAP